MQNSNKLKELKEQIFNSVKEYFKVKNLSKTNFIPGETTIHYAGRIYDESELINLVDSSLEFWLTEGRYAIELQTELSSFIGVKYCLLTSSGSAANLLAISSLKSSKLKKEKRLFPGDEIITVAAGFPTTIFPIIQNQAVPVFIDIELDTYNIDVSKLEYALSPKTKAIIIAHTLGNPFDVKNIKNFCDDNDIWLIEDNCDSLGSKYENNYTGSFGDISTFSFYPAHHITMGEGGALLTNNPTLYKILRSLRDWGRDCYCPPGKDNTCNRRFKWQLGTLPYGYDHKYIYSEFGYNLKLTDMQAAIGVAQMKKLPKFIKARQINHQKIYKRLEKFHDKIILPKPQDRSEPSWFGFLITLKNPGLTLRNKIMVELEKSKIQARLLFAGNFIRQPVFNDMRNREGAYKTIDTLENTDKVMNDSFWIGVYPGLNDQMMDYMTDKISDLLTN